MRRHVDVSQPTRVMLDHNKHVQHPECRSDRHEEVTGEDRLGMVLQEGGPALIATRLPRRSLRHVLAHGSRRDSDPELDQQLIGNPLLAPERVFYSHPANQAAQLRWNRWSARPALQAPENPPAQSIQRTMVAGRTLTTVSRQSNSLVNKARLTRVA